MWCMERYALYLRKGRSLIYYLFKKNLFDFYSNMYLFKKIIGVWNEENLK